MHEAQDAQISSPPKNRKSGNLIEFEIVAGWSFPVVIDFSMTQTSGSKKDRRMGLVDPPSRQKFSLAETSESYCGLAVPGATLPGFPMFIILPGAELWPPRTVPVADVTSIVPFG